MAVTIGPICIPPNQFVTASKAVPLMTGEIPMCDRPSRLGLAVKKINPLL